MSIDIPVLNSCCCLSLRTGAIIIGCFELFTYVMYFVDTLIYRLHIKIDNQQEYYLFLMSDVLFDYAEMIELIFCCVLIYGAIKEKSCYVFAWLMTEVAKLIDVIWNIALNTVYYFHLEYFIEEIIILGISIFIMWVGYSFYCTMPKRKYVL